MPSPRAAGPGSPSPAADVWLGVIFASLLGEFVAAAYFPSLRAIGIHGSAVLFLLLAAPALLVLERVRAFASHAPLLAVGALLGSLVVLPVVRALLLGLGLAGVAIALTAAALLRPRQVAARWIAGIIVLWALRALGGSFDPLYAGPVPTVLAAFVTLVAAARFRVGERQPTARSPRGDPRDGIPFGAVLCLVHGWFLGSTTIPRWASVDLLWQAAVAFALVIGFGVQLRWPFAVVGMALLVLADGAASLVGGLMLGLALPSAWNTALGRLSRGGPGVVPVAVGVYLGWFGVTVGAFAADYALGWRLYRPVVVALAIVAAALAASGGRTWSLRPRAILAGGGVVAAIPFLLVGVISPPHPVPGPLVAMTWNLQQGFDMSGRPNAARVAEVVRQEGATVVGLVEADATRSGGRDPAAWLARRLAMYSVIGPDPGEAAFGLAVLSAYPIRSSEVLLQSSGGDRVALLLATLDVQGRLLRVAVTHLGGPERHRVIQAQAVAEALAMVEGPLVLLGDFNASPGSEPMEKIAGAGLEVVDPEGETTVSVGVDSIDHILTKGLETGPARILDSGPVSDHMPVVALLSGW